MSPRAFRVLIGAKRRFVSTHVHIHTYSYISYIQSSIHPYIHRRTHVDVPFFIIHTVLFSSFHLLYYLPLPPNYSASLLHYIHVSSHYRECNGLPSSHFLSNKDIPKNMTTYVKGEYFVF